MATLTKQINNLNKRVVALENSELESTDAVPFIIKLYANLTTSPPIYCSEETEVSEDLFLSEGSVVAAAELATIINYGAVGIGIVPNIGDVGMPDEVARKPVSSITHIEESETQSVLILTAYFDEQTANGNNLTSAAMLGQANDNPGTGIVIAAGLLNIDKTSAKTLTVSTEITVTEVI